MNPLLKGVTLSDKPGSWSEIPYAPLDPELTRGLQEVCGDPLAWPLSDVVGVVPAPEFGLFIIRRGSHRYLCRKSAVSYIRKWLRIS